MDLNVSEIAFSDLDRRAEIYFSRLNEVFEKNWTRDYSPESIKSAGEKASAAAHEAREQLNKRIDPICDSYLAGTDKQRMELRAGVANFPTLLRALNQYIGWSQERIKGNEDRIHLRRALAAASLEDNRVNFKEMYLALGRLYEACVKSGVQPSLEFVKIAYLSNPEKNRGTSMQEFLANFEESAFFKKDVEPRLP
jgi:hypothetical protein